MNRLLIALILAAPLAAQSQVTVFSDSFSSSTVNSLTPGAPTANSTAYQVIASKAWNPNPPTITAGDLKYGIAATSGGGVEAQALFTATPVTLASAGDYVKLTLTFNNTVGVLNIPSYLGVGMFNASQVLPWAGGLNNSANNANSTAVTGGAQNWQGYVAQIATAGLNSRFMDRKAQTGPDNRNQVAVISGSAIYGPSTPSPVSIGTSGTGPSVTLALANPYTEVVKFTLLGTGALQLDSTLYDAGNNVLSTMSATTGTTPLTTTFDALSIGWRATSTASVTTLDISSIQVADFIQPVPEPSTLALAGLGTAALFIRRRRA